MFKIILHVLKNLDFPASKLLFFLLFFPLPFFPLFYSRQDPNELPCLLVYDLLQSKCTDDMICSRVKLPYSSNCGITFMPWRFPLICTKLFVIFHLPRSLHILFETIVLLTVFQNQTGTQRKMCLKVCSSWLDCLLYPNGGEKPLVIQCLNMNVFISLLNK